MRVQAREIGGKLITFNLDEAVIVDKLPEQDLLAAHHWNGYWHEFNGEEAARLRQINRLSVHYPHEQSYEP